MPTLTFQLREKEMSRVTTDVLREGFTNPAFPPAAQRAARRGEDCGRTYESLKGLRPAAQRVRGRQQCRVRYRARDGRHVRQYFDRIRPVLKM